MQDFHPHAGLTEELPASRDPAVASARPSTIETELLLRLMLSHFAHEQPAPDVAPPPAEPDLTEFCERLLRPDSADALQFIEALQAQGRSTDSIFLEVLAPAARRLGTLWELDYCDFIHVTIGLRRLQQILHLLGPTFDEESPEAQIHGRVLLLEAPGETHSLGIAMVEKFFRTAGWRTERTRAGDHLDVLGTCAFDVIGFSLSCWRFADTLAEAIAEARRVSLNPAIRVLVGGPLLQDDPTLAERLGADGTAYDAPGAVEKARSLLRSKGHV